MSTVGKISELGFFNFLTQCVTKMSTSPLQSAVTNNQYDAANIDEQCGKHTPFTIAKYYKKKCAKVLEYFE